jgi:hypothetical protein
MLKPEVAHGPEDPVVRSARREAVVSILIWLGAMTYTIGYCWRYAYDRAPGDVELIGGFPDWVLWGIVAPWLVCAGLSWWFAYGFMTDESLGDEAPPADDDLFPGDANDG